jgi:hypothetical protein
MGKKLWIILIFFVSITSCRYKEGNFSARAPQGWIQIDTVSKNGTKKLKMHARFSDSTSQFVDNISISIVHFRNLDDYINGVISELKKNSKYFKLEEERVFKSKIFEGKWIKHTICSSDFPENFEQKVYFLKDGRNIYMIVCSAKNNEIDRMQSKIDEVINSFKIL